MDYDPLPVNGLEVKHDVSYVRGGKTAATTVYTFYLGDHGPFTEKFPRDAPQPAGINARIDALRTELRGIVS